MKITVKERLIEFIEQENMSQRAFCLSIGKSPTFVSSMRKSTSSDEIYNISVRYPNLNIEWLLTGEGSMLRDFSQKNEINSEKSSIVGSNISGNGNTVNASTDVGKLIDEMGEQRKAYITQIDRLLNIIEQTINK